MLIFLIVQATYKQIFIFANFFSNSVKYYLAHTFIKPPVVDSKAQAAEVADNFIDDNSVITYIPLGESQDESLADRAGRAVLNSVLRDTFLYVDPDDRGEYDNQPIDVSKLEEVQREVEKWK